MVRVSAFQADDAGPIPAGCSILMFPLVIGSPAPSEGALSPFESEGNNHLSVPLVERLKAEVCKISRANSPHGGSNPSRHSKGDVAQRLVQRLHKALVGGPNPPIANIQTNMVANHIFNHKRLKDNFRWRPWCSGNMSACDAEVLGSTPRGLPKFSMP